MCELVRGAVVGDGTGGVVPPPIAPQIPETIPVVDAFQAPAACEPVFQQPPEFLREADQIRAGYSQDCLHIPENIPRTTSGFKFINRKQFVNTSDAEIFALYLSENEDAIQEILYSDHFTADDKSPINCPSRCRIQTYPKILFNIMRELHTKHDNLVHTHTHYLPRTRKREEVPHFQYEHSS